MRAMVSPMIPGITSWFKAYPQEAELIAGIVIGYGEIEFSLCCVLAGVMQDDFAATRLLYRLRGESQRIEAADAVIRPAVAKVKLLDKYAVAYGGLKRCKSIRNQYAHCHWTAAENLYFVNPSEGLSGHGPNPYKYLAVNLPLLKAQANLFRRTNRCLMWLSNEYDTKTGTRKQKNPWVWPKHFTLPPLNIDPSV